MKQIVDSVDNVDKVCCIIFFGNGEMSKKLEKTRVLRCDVRKTDRCYVNGIIHRKKLGKMLISMWIMWISGEKAGNKGIKKVDKNV